MPSSRRTTKLPLDQATRNVWEWLEQHTQRQYPYLLGISGLPGCGKTHLARNLARWANQHGRHTVCLSLDDTYLGLRARQQQARHIHPLFVTRGVPGSHDLPLLTSTLDALTQMTPGTLCSLPRFDKGHDTRYPPSHWIRVRTPPDLILFEGWLLGLGPQPEAALFKAQNALEQNEDSDGRWRREVNRRLVDYLEIWQRLDALVVLQAPSLQTAWAWRSQVEAELRKQQSPRAMTTNQLKRFLDHYERLSRHALFNLPTQADLLLQLDCKRNVSRSETH